MPTKNPIHKAKRLDSAVHELPQQRRLSASQRGYGKRWQAARRYYLRRNALCVKCLADGRYESATVVDHIVPHKGNKDLFWDRDNWQALCKRCHDVKTSTEDGGFGNRNGDK